MSKGEAGRLTDVDGHSYADFVNEYSAGLFGHSNPVILDAVRSAAADGIALGAPNRFEAQLASEVTRRFASIERVRFCNSGTEATLLALSTARAMTGRPKIMARVDKAIVFSLRYADSAGIDGDDEVTARAVRKYPDKFVGFAAVDPRRRDYMSVKTAQAVLDMKEHRNSFARYCNAGRNSAKKRCRWHERSNACAASRAA